MYEVVGDGRDFIFKDFNRTGERIDQDQRERLIGKSIFEVRPEVEQFGLIEVLRRGVADRPSRAPSDVYVSGWALGGLV